MMKIFLSIFILISSNVIASKVDFKSTYIFKNNKMNLIGHTRLTYYFWDVYDIAYYEGKNKKHNVLILKYLRNIESKASQEGWSKGLAPTKDKISTKWFKNISPDMEKGDELAIVRIQPSTTLIIKNGDTIAESQNKKIYQLAHYPWLGQIPIDEKLKAQLLGK